MSSSDSHHPKDCAVCLGELDREVAISQTSSDQYGRGSNLNNQYKVDHLARLEGKYSGRRPITFHPAKLPGSFGSTRLLAIELEVITIHGDYAGEGGPATGAMLEKWGAGLGADSYGVGGFEINTAPAAGANFIRQCREWQEALREDEAYVGPSCGGHVHVDSRDFCYPDMARLILLVTALEPAFYTMRPTYRRSGPWGQGGRSFSYGALTQRILSVAARKAPLGPSGWAELIMGNFSIRNRHSRDSGGDFGRRTSNLLASWVYRGSAEMRHPPGMITADEMIRWGRLYAWVWDFALRASLEEVCELAKATLDAKPEAQVDAASRALYPILKRSSSLREFVQERLKDSDAHWRLYQGRQVDSALEEIAKNKSAKEVQDARTGAPARSLAV
jgi:hypothetical protein